MKLQYRYRIHENYLRHLRIEFCEEQDTTEFLTMLLHVLGMYNFIVKDQQDIWQNTGIQVKLSAPNGTILLKIDQFKMVSFVGKNNRTDLLKIDAIFHDFYVFKKEELHEETYS